MTSLNPVLTIGDQVSEAFRLNAGLSRVQARTGAAEALDRVGIVQPEQTLDKFPHQLSGGMRQRVMIAMALAGEPKLLIADEPTTALDNSVQQQVLELLVTATSELGTSVLLVTHDLSVIAEVADRVVVMESGRVVEDSDVFELFDHPRHGYTKELIRLIPPVPQPQSSAGTLALPAESDQQPPLLEIREVSKVYRQSGRLRSSQHSERPAVDRVNLTVRQGETLGLVGESGSGKSTLGRLITRLIQPDSGQILLQGEDVHRVGANRLGELRRSVQMVFQDPYSSLNPRMRLNDIIAEPLITQRLADKKGRDRRVAELLDAVGLPASYAPRFPHELSGGQRQRVGIARALATNPALVVCDEPVSALDMSVQGQVLELLKSLQPEFGVTYLFIAHGLDSVYTMSDRIAVMQSGRVVEYGSRDQVFHAPQHPHTRQLLDARLATAPAESRMRSDRSSRPPANV